jgi:hypothetical protein
VKRSTGAIEQLTLLKTGENQSFLKLQPETMISGDGRMLTVRYLNYFRPEASIFSVLKIRNIK